MDADFTAKGTDPVEYRALSVSAKAWLRETGKGETDNPDIVRRDRASAAVFLEALTRKGFKCVDASGKPISRTVSEPTSQAGAVIGCGALVAVIAGAGLFFSGTLGGGGDKPAPVHGANQAASCDLPKCVDAQRAGIVAHGLDASALIRAVSNQSGS